MKTISLTYYAYLKDRSGIDQETFSTCANSLQELYEEIQEKYDIGLSIDSLKVAVNDQFAAFDTPLQNNDHVVFIPPLAGG